jgi:hypothetical protein
MRRKLAALSACLLAVPIAACGEDDEKEASKSVLAAFEFSGKGDKAKLTGPGSVDAGAVRVNFKNSGKEDAGVTIIRIDGGHTAAEAVKAGGAWGEGGKSLPDWVRFVGGASSVSPGASFSAVQVLTPGNYAGVDINSNKYKAFEVKGDGGGELPSTSAEIVAREYSFEAQGLKAGKSRVRFTNEGKEPHFALAAPIKPGKTIDDVRKAIRTEEGEPPIIEKETVATGVLDGDRSQVVDLQLRKGRYALVCFIPDRKGGPPHAVKGMVSEGVVR